MKDNLKKAAALSGAVLATAAAELITADRLVSEAVDREEPQVVKVLKKPLMKTLTDEGYAAACAAAGEELDALPLELLEVYANDGVRLLGHWYPCANGKRIIIAFHGWRSCWNKAYGLIAPFWHEQGCSVLFAEQRGQNNSGGECMGFGLKERYDCALWAEYISCRCGTELPIYLWGTSMGASTVLMATALPLPPNVRGVVADCGFTSAKKIWKHVANKNLHIPYYLQGFLTDSMFKKRVGELETDYSTTDALKECHIPLLLVHGEADGFVPMEMSLENLEACAGDKRLLTVPGAGHAMSYYFGRESYEEAVTSFWNDCEG